MNQPQAHSQFADALVLIREGNGKEGYAKLGEVWHKQAGYIQQLEHEIVILKNKLLNARRHG